MRARRPVTVSCETTAHAGRPALSRFPGVAGKGFAAGGHRGPGRHIGLSTNRPIDIQMSRLLVTCRSPRAARNISADERDDLGDDADCDEPNSFSDGWWLTTSSIAAASRYHATPGGDAVAQCMKTGPPRCRRLAVRATRQPLCYSGHSGSRPAGGGHRWLSRCPVPRETSRPSSPVPSGRSYRVACQTRGRTPATCCCPGRPPARDSLEPGVQRLGRPPRAGLRALGRRGLCTRAVHVKVLPLAVPEQALCSDATRTRRPFHSARPIRERG